METETASHARSLGILTTALLAGYVAPSRRRRVRCHPVLIRSGANHVQIFQVTGSNHHLFFPVGFATFFFENLNPRSKPN